MIKRSVGYQISMSTSYQDFNRAMIQDLRANDGKASGGPFKGRDMLILTTTGAKSNAQRETPLVYSRDNEHHVILGSKGGAPTHPNWYHNLQAHPIVTVEADGEKFKARAKVIAGEEYERLYKQHADINPGFWDYRKKTTRKIPVIVLERLDS
jgi:deazaflavin-dependent oxidoreductase (nitroreductase family)